MSLIVTSYYLVEIFGKIPPPQLRVSLLISELELMTKLGKSEWAQD